MKQRRMDPARLPATINVIRNVFVVELVFVCVFFNVKKGEQRDESSSLSAVHSCLSTSAV